MNVLEQMDAQEFLMGMCDRLDDLLQAADHPRVFAKVGGRARRAALTTPAARMAGEDRPWARRW